jgi:hypothetical protein
MFYLVAFGNSFVATAKRAQTFTKRQMNIETYAFRSIALFETLQECLLPFGIRE